MPFAWPPSSTVAVSRTSSKLGMTKGPTATSKALVGSISHALAGSLKIVVFTKKVSPPATRPPCVVPVANAVRVSRGSTSWKPKSGADSTLDASAWL